MKAGPFTQPLGGALGRENWRPFGPPNPAWHDAWCNWHVRRRRVRISRSKGIGDARDKDWRKSKFRGAGCQPAAGLRFLG